MTNFKNAMLLILSFLPSSLIGSETSSITYITISNAGKNPDIAISVGNNSRLKQPMFESFDKCEYHLFKLYKKYYEGNDEYTVILSSDNPRGQPFMVKQQEYSSFLTWHVCVDLATLVP